MKATIGHAKVKTAVWALVLSLTFVFLTGATAPRFAPEWFKKGGEDRPVVVAHEYPPFRTVFLESKGLHVQIVTAVFDRAGMDVEVDIQPAKSLVIYALSQESTPAVIGEVADFSEVSRQHLVFVPFHVKTGRYFYYRPAHDKEPTWGGNPAKLKGYVCGLETGSNTEAYEKNGIAVSVGELPVLLERLKAGEIDVLGADADRAEWIIGTHFQDDKTSFGAMETPAWESFSFAVFNTNHENGALFASRFVDAMRQMLNDGSYDLILKNSGGKSPLSPLQRVKLEGYLDSLHRIGEKKPSPVR